MSLRRLPACLAFAAAFVTLAYAQPTPKTALLALSKQDHTLSIIDPATLHVVARVPVGDDPHEVIASERWSHRLRLQLRIRRLSYPGGHRSGRTETLSPPSTSERLRGPHGLAFVARQGVVHGGGCQGHRQLRSRHRQNRLDHGHRAEPHPHDLCLSRRQAHSHHQRELGHGHDSR